MGDWDNDGPSSPSASKASQRVDLSDIQIAELSESISAALKKLKETCALVGTSKDSSRVRAGIKSARDQLKGQLQRAAAECSGNKTMASFQQQVCDANSSYSALYHTQRMLQKLMRTIAELQKDFDNVVVENQRKERLHAVADDAAQRSGGGSGIEFMSADSATPLLGNQQQQQRVHVLRIGGKEVVQHDVAAVEAVTFLFSFCII
jgi:hypothetical protein